MPRADITKVSEVWRILRRSRDIWKSMPRDNSVFDAIAYAAREYGLESQRAWGYASISRSKMILFPGTKGAFSDLTPSDRARVMRHALQNPWAPGSRKMYTKKYPPR